MIFFYVFSTYYKVTSPTPPPKKILRQKFVRLIIQTVKNMQSTNTRLCSFRWGKWNVLGKKRQILNMCLWKDMLLLSIHYTFCLKISNGILFHFTNYCNLALHLRTWIHIAVLHHIVLLHWTHFTIWLPITIQLKHTNLLLLLLLRPMLVPIVALRPNKFSQHISI